ncbi:hypothetical protein [Actinomadura harenae]|uniref:hypothetical protein n=1 Tax=Actinomadura harenae TaxID=2483351 RepID=UPI0011C3F6F5|nr:hypothetical protein [Actinomadura harenae]
MMPRQVTVPGMLRWLACPRAGELFDPPLPWQEQARRRPEIRHARNIVFDLAASCRATPPGRRRTWCSPAAPTSPWTTLRPPAA